VGELAFPLAAALLLILVAVPLATLLSKAALVTFRQERGGGPISYLLLVSPVLVPAAWLLSAAAHHAEAREAALVCLLDHVAETCLEPIFLLAVLSLMLAFVIVKRQLAIPRFVKVRDARLERRLDRVCAAYPALVRTRLSIIEGRDVRTVGLLRARVEIGRQVMADLDDAALAAALLHEMEHVRSADPLRLFAAAACQTLNPLSFVLADELQRWRACREALCDEGAVCRGADPLALADALVAVARPHASHVGAHLGVGGGLALLEARVSLLLSYATDPPKRSLRRATVTLAFLLLAVVLLVVAIVLLPHHMDGWPLAGLHHHAERVFLAF
jgi:beta-lactamase regulating signal transducer with metallopeptidase domain